MKLFKNTLSFSAILLSINICSAQSITNYSKIEEAYNGGEFEVCVDLMDQYGAELTTAQDTIAANTLFYVGDSHLVLGELDKARTYFEKELTLRDKLNDLEEISGSLYNLTYLYNELGEYTLARSSVERLLKIDEQVYGKQSDDYLNSLIFYLETLSLQSEFNEVIKEGNKILDTVKPESPFYGIFLARTADAYLALGQYTNAENALAESLGYLAMSFGEHSTNYAASLATLSSLFMDKGMFPEAEETFQMALDILSKLDDPVADEYYFSTLNNLSLVYQSLSNYEQSLKLLNEIKESDSLSFGTDHPFYATTLNNLGTAYNELENYDKAIALFDKAAKIIKSEFGENSLNYATNLNNKGNALREQGNLSASSKVLEQALKIYKDKVGEESVAYSTAQFNLAKTYLVAENKKAGRLLLEASQTRKTILGAQHPLYGKTLPQLATNSWAQNDKDEALNYFNLTFENYLAQIDAYFPALSEQEKTKFYFGGLRIDFEKFNSFAVNNLATKPELSATMYNYQLNTKAMIMYATAKVRNHIMNSGDKELIDQYKYWLGLKEQLSKLYSGTDSTPFEVIDSLKDLTNTIEKDLSKKSAQFGKTYGRIQTSWEQVRDALKEGEAAVEVIRFRDFSPKKGGQFTGVIKYAILIIKPTTKDYPEIVVMDNGKIVEERYIINYRNSIRYQIFDTHSYGQLWETIAKQLKGIDKIYFSPDGIYNQISINSIYNPETEQYLLEEMDIQNVTNTKDILTFNSDKSTTIGESMLFGYPDYNFEDSTKTEKTGEQRSLRGLRGGSTRGLRAGLLRYLRGDEGISMLPGTKTEVDNIAGMFSNEQAKYSTFYNREADENTLKQASSPELLHVATHGFFMANIDDVTESDQNKYIENPLLRSGLILAGAGNFLQSGDDYNGQDGILTAYEAMNMNLDGTEVVVMSACETGLGTITNGEGVYGLQRAFIVAGAKSLIMSMWSVDDDATQRLMTEFYREWLKTGDKHASFRKAQYKVKEVYPQPFYWGAFVMVGE